MSSFDSEARARQPMFNLPKGGVVPLVLAICAVSGLQLLGPPWVDGLLVYAGGVATGGAAPPHQVFGPYAPLVLHVFLHGGLLHLGLNMAALLAFGAPCAQALGGAVSFWAFFFVCAVGGGLGQIAFASPGPSIMVGASTAVSGLLVGAAYVMRGARGRLASPFDPGLWSFLAPWVVINLGLGLFGGQFGGQSIAWAAHLGGMATGFVAFPLMARQRG
ncbi:MAG: rhomboid family intramembrane serine protease [Maricaulaceae bacterium]